MTSGQDRMHQTQDTAQDEAENIASKGQDAAAEAAKTAKQEAMQVADEATAHLKALAGSAQDEVLSQAGTQQRRLAEQTRLVTDDLHRLARGERPETNAVRMSISILADRAEQFTSQLESKSTTQLVDGVRRFAARRPLAFLAIAAGIGLAAGRITRGLTDSDGEPENALSQGNGNSSTASLPEHGSTSSVPAEGRVTPRPTNPYPEMELSGDVHGENFRAQQPSESRGRFTVDNAGGRHFRDSQDPEARP